MLQKLCLGLLLEDKCQEQEPAVLYKLAFPVVSNLTLSPVLRDFVAAVTLCCMGEGRIRLLVLGLILEREKSSVLKCVPGA